ncbi:restriction endonuclease subunit S [Leuconostoc mesenteroides]|uniref:restriction endonuclease subunit S n=1 Tax=Leuconostoc mesenteroides TaxID=1245 RepID=UPI001CBA8909|nr:restriction endonuclease subunit S [Leuconostoc mesenteroides]
MNKMTPQIRFQGFTDDWEERKLGRIGETFTGLSGKTKEDFGHGDAKFVTYVNVFENPISNPNKTERVEIDEKQNQIKYGDVFFTTSSETPEEVGMSSVWLDNTENIYLNSFCFGYRPTTELDSYYLAFMLRSPSIRKKFMFLAQGISRYNISKTKVMELEVPVPEIDEQKKVGSFFKTLDDTIALHQRKLDLLKEQKKGFLQKMFPKNGAKVPELRFAGFADDWEERKLSEGTSKIGDGLHGTPNYSDNGDVFFINGNNLVNGKIVITKETKLVTESNQSKDDKLLNMDTILMSINGTIGNLAWYNNERVMLGKSAAYLTVSNFDKKFIFSYLQTSTIKNYFLNNLTGTTIKNLGLKTIRDTTLFVPTLEEQQKIGSLFKQLDDTIALHQRKLDLLKEQKKGFLQKMFIS